MNTLTFEWGNVLLLIILSPNFLFSQTVEEEIGEVENMHVAKAHIFEHLGLSQSYYSKALQRLNLTTGNPVVKAEFLRFSEGLMVREY